MKKTISVIIALICMTVSSMASAQALDGKEKSVALIAAYTARGDMEKLDGAFDAGLDAGLSVNEIKEILVQMYAYCGFPRSLNALNRFMAKTEQRAADGKHDEAGREASPVPAGTDMSALGEEVRTALVGQSVTGKVYEFCPVIDEYLRSHLFGDIFARDNLSHRYRELATVGALAGMNLEGQLRSHLAICRNLGYTQKQLNDFAALIASEVGSDEGQTAATVVETIFK